MVVKYLNYENLNIDEELKKIEQCERADLVLEPSNKKCLFILGMLFAKGKPIRILNKKGLDFTVTKKSFTLMPYVWSLLGRDSFPNKKYSNVKTEMKQRVENIKRLGVSIKEFQNNPKKKKIFLICPVRNATDEQRKWIEDFVVQKRKEGYTIHAPHLHTRQEDMFGGFAICTQNAEAVATSSEIDIYYDQSSTGSVFDLGVAYALHKPLKLLNEKEVTLNNNDFMDRIVSNWKYNRAYKLQDQHGKTYLSEIPGKLGGNKRLKIYGRLDCPSANRWVLKGSYAANRVFFMDEATAIAAGYRPCAVCMPEEYKKWKEKVKK